MKKRFPLWLRIIFGILVLLVGTYFVFTLGRPAAVPLKRRLFDGVIYHRVVRYLPHSMIAHILVIDTKAKGLKLMVTPPDEVDGGALQARTTSQFLK